MANNLTASFPEVWARTQQEVFMKKSVAMVIADTSFNATMNSGDTLHRTYPSVNDQTMIDTYTRGADIPETSVTDTDETLTVNKEFAVRIVLDNFDKIQSNYNAAATYGKEYGRAMQTQLDADVLAEVVNAASTVDAGTLGGITGQGIALTTNNVLNAMMASTKKLNKLNVYEDNRVAVVSPEFEEVIGLFYGVKATDLGDKVSENGYFNKMSGYKLHSSNNILASAVLALGSNPSNGHTVTISGQVFTFVNTIGTTAGNVLIGADAAATRANLAALINTPETTTANGVALTGANLLRFKTRARAVVNNVAGTVQVFMAGENVLVVAASNATWTAELKKQHCIFGVANKCTTLVVQSAPQIKIKDHPFRDASQILNTMLYGVKTFSDNAKYMVNVEIGTSSY